MNTKTLVIFVMLLLFFITAPAAAQGNSISIADLAVGEIGMHNVSSTLRVSNLFGEEADCQLTILGLDMQVLVRGPGETTWVRVNSLDFSLPPYGSGIVEFQHGNNGADALLRGGLHLEATSQVSAVLTYRVVDGFADLVTSVGVIGVEPSEMWSIPIANTENIITGVAFSVPGNQDASVNIKMYNDDGDLTGEVDGVTITAGGHMAALVHELLKTEVTSGQLIVTSNTMIAATALAVEGFNYSALPVTSLD